MNPNFEIQPVKCLVNNIAWLIYNKAKDEAVVIDPGEGKSVIKALGKRYKILYTVYNLSKALIIPAKAQ